MRKIFLTFAAVVALAFPAPVRAAVQVTNLTDFQLPDWSIGQGAVSASIDMCVANIVLPILSDGSYAVTVNSTGGFVLKDGTNQIVYTVFWDDAGAGNLGGAGTQLTNNIKLSNRQNANILSSLCALGLSGPNARLTIKITQAAMTGALAGTYIGTLNILISPT